MLGVLLGDAQEDARHVVDADARRVVRIVRDEYGLVGAAERPTIDNCHAYGDCFAIGIPNGHGDPGHDVAALGGLVGYTFPSADHAFGTTIRYSSAHGNVSSPGQFTGGLVGLCWGASISYCFAKGDVTGGDRRLGGLIGGVVAQAVYGIVTLLWAAPVEVAIFHQLGALALLALALRAKFEAAFPAEQKIRA